MASYLTTSGISGNGSTGVNNQIKQLKKTVTKLRGDLTVTAGIANKLLSHSEPLNANVEQLLLRVNNLEAHVGITFVPPP